MRNTPFKRIGQLYRQFVELILPAPFQVPEKCDIELRGRSQIATTELSGAFNMILIDD